MVSARAAVPDVLKFAEMGAHTPLGLSMYRPLGAGAADAGPQDLPPGRQGGAVGQPADAREHGRARARRGQLPHRRHRPGRRCADLHLAARLQAAMPSPPTRSSPRRCRGCSRTPSPGSSAARSKATTSTAWCCAPACRPTRWWCCAPIRSTCARSASRCRSRSSAARLVAHPHIARMLVQLFKLRFDPRGARRRGRHRAGARHRARAGQGAQPRARTASAPVPGADPGHAAHQLLAHRRRPFRRARRRRSLLSFKFDSSKVPGLPDAEAAGRDLRLFAALRRHPPARRQGGARRPALERPGRGLPHRGAGPGEGADGEEHGHRAGGQQGRLRAEEGAAGQRPRGLDEGRRGLLPGLPARACST